MDRYVDFLTGDVGKIHQNQLNEMKRIASSNVRKKRYRLCLHESPESSLHEMLICRTKGEYIRPDKHKGISESHTIIEGKEAIILFSDNGEIMDIFILDRNEGYITYRINSEIYHMTIPLTDYAIDYEVKPGPFLPECNIFPSWAPEEDDEEGILLFLNKIEKKMPMYLKQIFGGEI